MTALTITEQTGYLTFQDLTYTEAGPFGNMYEFYAHTYSSTYKYNRSVAFSWPIADADTMPSIGDVLAFLQGQAIYGPVSWGYGTLNYYMSTSSWPNFKFLSGTSGSTEDGSPTTYTYANVYGFTPDAGYEVRGAIVCSWNYPGAPSDIDPNRSGMFSHASLAPPPAPIPPRTRAIGGNLRLRQRQTFRIT